MTETYNLKVKICVVGDTEVGKTSLIRRYVMDFFEDKYISTLGTKVSKKQLLVKKVKGDIKLILSIWDILGQEDFKKIRSVAFKGSKGALLVCDLTRKNTLMNLLKWNQRIKEITGDIPTIVLANKSDLTNQYTFSEQELQECSSKCKAPFFMTSAKFGDNVIKTFFQLGELITEDILKDINKG